MEDSTSRTPQDLNLAARKTQEAALRRFQATQWLESLLGAPLGVSSQPSEREFIYCLRNGLILCNAINKIQPGSVPKVVANQKPSQSLIWDSQPLPAYQYFENVRNFLVAVEELKLTAFEAAVLERDNLEAGSSAKVVDCILELKAFHEWKQMGGGNGFYKPQRSPLVTHSVGRICSRVAGEVSLDPRRQLDLSAICDKDIHAESQNQKLEESIVTALADCLIDRKENIDANLLASFRDGNPDAVKFLRKAVSSCLQEQIQNRLPELKPILSDLFIGESSLIAHSPAASMGTSSVLGGRKCCRACLKKGYCNHYQLFKMQEKELLNLKSLLSRTKKEFEDLQSQLQRDIKQLEIQVQEMSTAALGYHKVVKENMNLYNMVQDLKGSIRVYCRIRPSFHAKAKDVLDFIGKDGSLAVSDPLKPIKDGRKVFRFDRVFGPTATQDEVFRDTQPLIRSVMDGYNVCIFAYGQTGSGKTHTMSGPSTGSAKEQGINYLALDDLFQLANKRKDIVKYDIHVQMVEIYNEQVRDLLAEEFSTTKLEIQSCTNDNSLIPDARMHSVTSTGDVIKLMKLGELNRAVSSTAINNRSSRSHSMLTVHVHGKDVAGSIIRSCLHLVDLAGSEHVDKSEVTGDGLREAQYINKSLSCLGDVITALAQKNSHIPYRNSKLTLLLQNSLGGHGKTLMFAHVSPEGDSFGETITTLKFAQRVSIVELGAARPQRESSEVMELREQLESLKRALSKRESQIAEVDILNEKSMTDQTPPAPAHSRRLSIESSSVVNMEKTQANKLKETKPHSEKPKAISVRTPLSRRSSIENCNTAKLEKSPRFRRLSIETPGTVKMEKAHANKLKETKSPSEKPKVIAERTPPRSRRLSIGNCNTTKQEKSPRFRRLSIETPGVIKTEKAHANKPKETKSPSEKPKLIADCNSKKRGNAANFDVEMVSKIPSAQTLARRLSLEGPKYVNKNSVNLERSAQPQRAPKSPIHSVYQSQVERTENKTKIPSLQLPKTPEPTGLARVEPQMKMESELVKPLESQTSTMKASTNGKASQLRKSLRAIRKLINGSEKRNQQKQSEKPSAFNGSSRLHNEKSPVAVNARALRRQSLNGVQPLDVSTRTSPGGNSNDHCLRNAKTPPPVHPSAKATRRWV